MSTIAALMSNLSGAFGTKVFARNQYGPYVRNRKFPAFPNTPEQVITTRQFSRMLFRWARTLTAAQRRGWDDYASRRVDYAPNGRRKFLTGRQVFLRSNMPLAYTNLAEVRDAPVAEGPIVWHEPFNVDAISDSDVLFNLDTTDDWANEIGSMMLIQVSNVNPSTVNFFKGPWRRSDHVVATAGGVPSLNHMFNPFEPKAGPRRWIRSYVRLVDGRTTSPRVLPYDSNV